VLRGSHDHLAGIVADLDDAALEGPSYCADWNVAQVLSHLGSGAEIGYMNLDAVLAGRAAPERSDYEAVWARWNAKSPREMADDFLVADEANIAKMEGLSDDELDALVIPFFSTGRVLDATGAALMRLGEHAVHTWDIEVTTDPSAALQARPVELIVDALSDRTPRLARGEKPAGSLAVTTSEPEREFVLSFGEEASLVPGAGAADGSLEISAEALIRLMYGRLDAAHTPSEAHTHGPVDLDALRGAFPGF
jgi:uncharacterized protein (TIGR03083 family)